MTNENTICWSPLTVPPALVYFETTDAKTAETAANFIEQVRTRCPFRIQTILTDNGKEFTDRFTSGGERVPTGRHCCSQVCRRHQSLHRLIAPRHPNTNGMVERFNGRLANILQSTYFQTADEMRATLRHYLKIYNTLRHYLKIYNTRYCKVYNPYCPAPSGTSHTGSKNGTMAEEKAGFICACSK